MKTTVYFYLNDKEETEITSIYSDTLIEPFKKGDKFWFSWEFLYPVTMYRLREKYSEDFVQSIYKTNKEKIDKFHNTQLKVISVYRSFTHNSNNIENGNDEMHTMHIEYKCKFVNKIYWKFWETYKFKKVINKWTFYKINSLSFYK